MAKADNRKFTVPSRPKGLCSKAEIRSDKVRVMKAIEYLRFLQKTCNLASVRLAAQGAANNLKESLKG